MSHRHVGHGRRGDEVAYGRHGRIEVLAPDRPHVDLELGVLGDDVGPGPAVDDADVAGHARPPPVEGVEGGDQVGGGEDRTAALLGLDPGMGGPAVDGDPGVDDALARADDVAVGPGALEDEGRRRRRRRARG